MEKLWQFLTAMLISSLFISSLSVNTLAGNKPTKRKSSLNAAQPAPILLRTPYSLEVAEDSGAKGITAILAVGRVSIIHCPEEPMQILFGDESVLDHEQSVTNAQTAIYLRPRAGNLDTNIVIELKSGPIVVYVKTLEVKGGASVGQYTGEITIKNNKYKTDLATTTEELNTAKAEITKLTGEIEKLQAEKKTQVVAVCQEDKAALLKLLETNLIISDRHNSVENKQFGVTQIGKIQRTASGGYLINLAIENKGKEFISLEDIKIPNGKVIEISKGRKISPKAETKIVCLFESDVAPELQTPPKEVILVIGNITVTVKAS